MRNPRNSSPEAGLVAEMGFPAVGHALNGSYSTHATRSPMKNLANYRKDPRDKHRRGWALGWTELTPLVCSPSVSLSKRDWLEQVQPPGSSCFPLGEGVQVGPSLSWSDATEAAGTGGHWGDQDPPGPPQAPELEMLQRARACRETSPTAIPPSNKPLLFSLSPKQWAEGSLF